MKSSKPGGGSSQGLSHVLGACGLYCGACHHYRASLPEGKHLLEPVLRQGRTKAAFTCQGCRSDRLYIHTGCADCQIRACVERGGLLHCGQCERVPCERLEAFMHDGHLHHLHILTQLERLTQAGPDAWLGEQARRWTCRCGAPFSWYEARCHSCGALLDSIG